ncbi:MAG TPA: alkaline phosphatase family protein [Bryobacteraceae bacterium]|jgi:predicted AlkP superfamily pyrophosphatase or phosphodiesterase|nr:alkaline phosphatase family protein [Bryobacteraceae bacterium]
MKRLARACALLSFSVLPLTLAAQTPKPAVPTARHAARKPKLLLTIVIDQFRFDYLTRFRQEYHGGFDRLLTQGAVFTNAHHIHFPTVTAIGHSTFLTGATPSVSGIIGNEWYDRNAKKVVTSVSDEETKELGGAPNTEGASPRRLLVDTVPDEMKIAGKTVKVIGISLKDRASILPSGHMADRAYWYDEKLDRFVSSTYYGSELPQWAREANAAGPASKYKSAAWTAVNAKPGDKPFCSIDQREGLRHCAVGETPFGNDIVEEFAERAIESEQLGKHPGTDVLAISFSSNDRVGHGLGPDSPEVHDISVRTDQVIGKLLRFLDAKIGAGNTLVVLTADHGVANLVEANQARKMPGGRLDLAKLKNALQAALEGKYGPGEWMLPGGYSVYLNYDLLASKHIDPAEARRVVADAALAFPHIARAYTRDEVERGDDANDPVSKAVRYGFYGPRSGDVFIVPEPYYMFSAKGTTHGTPYLYDSHVPVIFYGPGIRKGVYRSNVAVNDVAPTLSAIFDVQMPAGAFGRVLTEALE